MFFLPDQIYLYVKILRKAGSYMTSKYVQVYTDLKKKIENRELDVGQALPAEGELMDRYQVSRDTVRKARAFDS